MVSALDLVPSVNNYCSGFGLTFLLPTFSPTEIHSSAFPSLLTIVIPAAPPDSSHISWLKSAPSFLLRGPCTHFYLLGKQRSHSKSHSSPSNGPFLSLFDIILLECKLHEGRHHSLAPTTSGHLQGPCPVLAQQVFIVQWYRSEPVRRHLWFRDWYNRQRFIWAQFVRLWSTMLGKTERQEFEVDGHIASHLGSRGQWMLVFYFLNVVLDHSPWKCHPNSGVFPH